MLIEHAAVSHSDEDAAADLQANLVLLQCQTKRRTGRAFPASVSPRKCLPCPLAITVLLGEWTDVQYIRRERGWFGGIGFRGFVIEALEDRAIHRWRRWYTERVYLIWHIGHHLVT